MAIFVGCVKRTDGPCWCVSRTLQLLLAILLLAGCRRGNELELVVVSGTVAYEGKPIDDGEIRFIPQGSTKGPTSAAAITTGRYEVTARGGVPAGTHLVEVRAFRPRQVAPSSPELPGSHSGGVKEQYLPKLYNEKSEMTATIESGQRRTTKDYALGNR
jgi:hypothetical protein